MRILVALFGFLLASISVQAQPLPVLPLIATQADTFAVADYFVERAGLHLVGVGEVHAEVLPDGERFVFFPSASAEGLYLIPVHQPGKEERLFPVKVRQLTSIPFRYPATEGVERVNVFGQFNDWNRAASPLTRAEDGSWHTELLLEAGVYQYKFFVDGAELVDPGNPVRVPNGFGDFNNVLEVQSRHTEVASLLVQGFDADSRTASFVYLVNGRPAETAGLRAVALLGEGALPESAVSRDGATVRVTVPENATGHLRVAVQRDGQTTRFSNVFLENGALATGFQWRDAILYQIMVDRFVDGDPTNTRRVEHDSVAVRANYHGGDLAGILQKLREGYFTNLGVNTLWLSPVIQNTDRAHREYPPPHRFYTAYHGYWPTHPERVDERFGSMELLRTLVQEAEARGIRVLLDFVANHTHEDHPFFQNNPEWFGTLNLPDGRKNLRLWDEHRLTTWFEPFLPSFDFVGSEEALEAMTDNAIFWLRESGAHGFRHDAVKHIPNEFWRRLTQKIRTEIDPERTLPVYQIGETFGSYGLISSYVTPGQMDAQFNFNLYDAQLSTFLNPDVSFAFLEQELGRGLDVYGTAHVMGTLMDSHDKVRFLALADGDIPEGQNDQEVGWATNIQVDHAASLRRAELLLAFLLTTPGVPTIYYGVEFGMTGGGDPDNRRPMRFGDELSEMEREMKSRVVPLIQLRRDRSALRRGDVHTLHVAHDAWAYLRADAESRVVVVLNKGTEPITWTMETSALPLPVSGVMDALTGEALVPENGHVVVQVPAGGYRILDLR